MDAQVKGAVVIKEALGNLSPLSVTFFNKDIPAVALVEGERLAILRFKTDKESNTKRANMAVKVFAADPDKFTSKSEFEFVQALIHSHQDSLLVRCANGEITQDEATSKDWMVKDYFDNSRDSSGRLVTKESIGAWYDKTVASLVEARAKTKNAQMTPETVANVVKGYREMFQKFTGYALVNAFTEPQLVLLRTLMVSAVTEESEDAIGEYILGKLAKISEQKKAQDNLVDAI
jgi:hypothetical protein